MFYQIQGSLLKKQPFLFVIELKTGGGSICFEIHTPLSLYEKYKEGESVTLKIYPYFQEKGIILYGFESLKEREIFTRIVEVPGIGPRVALQILSTYTVERFWKIIEEGDTFALSSIKGVGKKRAAHLLLELKQKLPELTGTETSLEQQALDVLGSLGLTKKEGETLLRKVKQKDKYKKLEDLLQAIFKERIL